MELPKFNETFLPILEVLRDGNIIKGRELLEMVEKRFYSKLPRDLLEKTTKSGDRLISNRIAWGKSYLKKGGLVHFPKRGYVQITKKGKLEKAEDISLQRLQENVIDFYEPENKNHTKNSIENNATPQDLIDMGFEQIESNTKNILLSKLKEIDPYAFEKIILILLSKMGYGEFIETSKSGDGGIDGIINEDQL